MNRKIPNEELERLDIDAFKRTAKIPVRIILDNVRSAQNVGSIFRTMDAFLLDSIHLCGITAAPPNREIQKTALGATQSVDWTYWESTKAAVEQLRTDGYLIYAIEQVEGATPLQHFHQKGKIALIFGNEVEGVSDEIIALCDGFIEIPQFGTKHSLNISVCAGITIWHFWSLMNLR
jgi:tRNA G18 (ribose-2'-O)-methylase SpoU